MIRAVLPAVIFAVIMGLYGEYWARRDRAVEARIAGLVDLAHAAGTN